MLSVSSRVCLMVTEGEFEVNGGCFSVTNGCSTVTLLLLMVKNRQWLFACSLNNSDKMERRGDGFTAQKNF